MAVKRLKSRSPLTARQYQPVEVNDLTGGLDLRRSPSLLAPDRSRELVNFALTNPGELGVRPGYMKFSTTNLGNSRIQGGQRVYLGSTTFTRLAWNGAVYGLSDAGVLDSTALYSTISPTAEVYFPYDRELVAVMDGANRPRKSTDGVTWTLMGIDASTAVPSTITVATAGTLSSSEFEVSFTYKDRGTAHQSNGGVGSTVSLSATGAIAVQVPNSTDSQVDAIVLYARNLTAGETVLRRVSSAAVQGGASSTYVISSSDWSANSEIPTNHDVPLAMKFAVSWKNRWWGVHPTIGNRLCFTELFRNQAWPILFTIDIPFERGDEITAVVPQGDTLILFGQSKTGYVIIGTTSLDFEVRPSAGMQAGAFGHRATAVVENGVVHASAEGVFIFDGATDRYLSFDIEPAWRDLIGNTAASVLAQVALVYHFPTKELRITVPRRFPSGVAGEWVLDLNRTREQEQPAWTSTDRTIGGYILFDGDETAAGLRGQVYSWHSSTQGTVWVESTGTTANSSNMIADYTGPTFALGLHKTRLIDVRGEYEPHAGTFSIEPIMDGVSQGSQTQSIGAEGLPILGVAILGTATLGGAGRRMWHQQQPLEAEGRTMRLQMRYVGQESFRVFTYSLGLVPESRMRSFSD